MFIPACVNTAGQLYTMWMKAFPASLLLLLLFVALWNVALTNALQIRRPRLGLASGMRGSSCTRYSYETRYFTQRVSGRGSCLAQRCLSISPLPPPPSVPLLPPSVPILLPPSVPLLLPPSPCCSSWTTSTRPSRTPSNSVT